MNLSIVIPAFNEERRLPASLIQIERWLREKRFKAEIIVVDDGSRDGTLAKLKKLKTKIPNLRIITYQPNRGKGYALKKGMLVARGKYVIFTDVDLSTPIEEAEKLLKALKRGNEIVYGSRFIAGARVLAVASPFRNLMAKIFGLGVRLLLLSGPKDTQCGFKGFSRLAARKIFANLKSNSVLFDLEIFLLAKKFNLKLKEVGVIWKHDPDSRLRYNLKKALAVWLELLRLKALYKIFLPVKI